MKEIWVKGWHLYLKGLMESSQKDVYVSRLGRTNWRMGLGLGRSKISWWVGIGVGNFNTTKLLLVKWQGALRRRGTYFKVGPNWLVRKILQDLGPIAKVNLSFQFLSPRQARLAWVQL